MLSSSTTPPITDGISPEGIGRTDSGAPGGAHRPHHPGAHEEARDGSPVRPLVLPTGDYGVALEVAQVGMSSVQDAHHGGQPCAQLVPPHCRRPVRTHPTRAGRWSTVAFVLTVSPVAAPVTATRPSSGWRKGQTNHRRQPSASCPDNPQQLALHCHQSLHRLRSPSASPRPNLLRRAHQLQGMWSGRPSSASTFPRETTAVASTNAGIAPCA